MSAILGSTLFTSITAILSNSNLVVIIKNSLPFLINVNVRLLLLMLGLVFI